MKPSPVKSTIDFEQDGLQHGFLKLPHSHDKSAYGSMMIPISMAKNGEGPTALLTGGNHGDEYEGPIALFDLARTIDPRQIRGRVILVPAMNYPAFQAGKRTSPIDSGNMNRSFPGNPEGSITEKLRIISNGFCCLWPNGCLTFTPAGKPWIFFLFAQPTGWKTNNRNNAALMRCGLSMHPTA